MNSVAILAVAFGGAIGAVARYGVSSWVGESTNGAHWGILAANLIGCILIGAARAAVDSAGWGSESFRLFLFTGFIGSFTTFSTFESDIVSLWTHDAKLLAVGYASISVLGGLALYLASWWTLTKAIS